MKNFRNVILDASSLIAFIYAEEGHNIVTKVLHCSVMSAINVSEVIKYMINCNAQKTEIDSLLDKSLYKIVDFDREQSYLTAELNVQTKKYGLSLADRACIALALKTGYPIYTADKVWKNLVIEHVDIYLIR